MTNPENHLSVWVTEKESPPKRYSVYPKKDGSFSFKMPEKPPVGEYEIWAIAIDENQNSSDPSEKIKISVRPPVIENVIISATRWLAILIPFIALVFIFIAAIMCGWRRIVGLRRKIRQETLEMENTINKKFSAIKKSMKKQVKILEEAGAKRRLTTEEEKIIWQIKKDLEDAEQELKQEVEDIRKEIR